MKKLFVSLLVTFAITSAVQAQSKDEQEVAKAVEALRTAMIDANKAGLDAITASDLSYGHSSGTLEDKPAFIEALVSGKSDFITMDLSKQTIKIVGNTALVRHELRGDTPTGKVNLGILLVWQKQKGKWLLLARQAFKI